MDPKMLQEIASMALSAIVETNKRVADGYGLGAIMNGIGVVVIVTDESNERHAVAIAAESGKPFAESFAKSIATAVNISNECGMRKAEKPS